MKMTGLFHIALLPDTDETAFVKRMATVLNDGANPFQATRITSGFSHRLLKRQSRFADYAWQTTVDLVTDHGYDFDQNAGSVQAAIKGMGLLTGIDVYTHVDS
jgi:hypothetical protein